MSEIMETPVAENAEEIKGEASICELDLQKIKEVIDNHFKTVEGLVRYNKSKDENVLSLSKQIQVYRDGFAKGTYKRIALELISFREDCRKTLRDSQGNQQGRAETVKYLGFLCEDFRDIMQNIGLEQKGDSYYFNGKSLETEPGNVEIREPEETLESGYEGFNDSEIKDFDSLVAYLKCAEEAVTSILRHNAVLDSLLASYIKMASVYEEGLYQVILYPTMRRIVDFHHDLVCRVESESEAITDENAPEVYASVLESVIGSLEEILCFLDVSIDRDYRDSYDAKTDRILKRIPTDNRELDGKIANRFSDCYVMDDKVIFPAKVGVYMFKSE